MEGTITEDIRQQRSTSILIGLCVTLAIMFAAFELTQIDVKVEEEAEPSEETSEEAEYYIYICYSRSGRGAYSFRPRGGNERGKNTTNRHANRCL